MNTDRKQASTVHCNKGLVVFPSPAGMSLTRLSRGGNNINYSRPGIVWSVTSRLGTKKRLTLFSSVVGTVGAYESPTQLFENKEFFRLACLSFLLVCLSSVHFACPACRSNTFFLSAYTKMFACRMCCNCIFIYAIQYIVFLVLSLKLWSVAVKASFRISIVLPLSIRKRSKAPRSWISFSNPGRFRRKFFNICFLNLCPVLRLRKGFVERRGYWMFYRKPGFSRPRMIWQFPHPLPPSLVSSFDRRHRKTEKERNLADGRGGGGGGANSYDVEKPWSSVNHSILSSRASP